MARRNQLGKAFALKPVSATDKLGKPVDLGDLMVALSRDVTEISDYALYLLRCQDGILDDLDKVSNISQPSGAGFRMGIDLPDWLKQKGTGESRRAMLLRYNVVSLGRSWLERVKACKGSTTKRVSQGWKRTMNASPPSWGTKPSLSIGSVDKQYASFIGNPLESDTFSMRLVVNREWYTLNFRYNHDRFKGADKVSLPLVTLDSNGSPVFRFTALYTTPVVQFSSRYIIGVDVGKVQYATLVVWDTQLKRVVAESTLSKRCHSLWNSIRASEKQVNALWTIVDTNPFDKQVKAKALDEIPFHRASASRKKEELAILAGQEIAAWSHEWGNAPVVFEDLSWITNTMQNGRWNRGSLLNWTTHYVTQNGGWVLTTSAYNTSQVCHQCGTKGRFRGRIFHCTSCGLTLDRDVNAGANIAQKSATSVTKARKTRSKNRNLTKITGLRTPKRHDTLKYPGRDRTKTGPTPKRKRHQPIKEVNLPVTPATGKGFPVKVVADGIPHGDMGTQNRAGEIMDKGSTLRCSPYQE